MRNNNTMTEILMLLMGVIVGLLIALVLSPKGLSGGIATEGIPIHDIAITEDGLTLTFYIGTQQWQATMKEPVSRPPNMSMATTMFIETNELLFLNAEGQNVFGGTLKYIDSLRILEG